MSLSTLVLFIFSTLPSDNFVFACNTIQQVHLDSHHFIYIENKVNVLSNAGHTWVETLVGSRVQVKIATCFQPDIWTPLSKLSWVLLKVLRTWSLNSPFTEGWKGSQETEYITGSATTLYVRSGSKQWEKTNCVIIAHTMNSIHCPR